MLIVHQNACQLKKHTQPTFWICFFSPPFLQGFFWLKELKLTQLCKKLIEKPTISAFLRKLETCTYYVKLILSLWWGGGGVSSSSFAVWANFVQPLSKTLYSHFILRHWIWDGLWNIFYLYWIRTNRAVCTINQEFLIISFFQGKYADAPLPKIY